MHGGEREGGLEGGALPTICEGRSWGPEKTELVSSRCQTCPRQGPTIDDLLGPVFDAVFGLVLNNDGIVFFIFSQETNPELVSFLKRLLASVRSHLMKLWSALGTLLESWVLKFCATNV